MIHYSRLTSAPGGIFLLRPRPRRGMIGTIQTLALIPDAEMKAAGFAASREGKAAPRTACKIGMRSRARFVKKRAANPLCPLGQAQRSDFHQPARFSVKSKATSHRGTACQKSHLSGWDGEASSAATATLSSFCKKSFRFSGAKTAGKRFFLWKMRFSVAKIVAVHAAGRD